MSEGLRSGKYVLFTGSGTRKDLNLVRRGAASLGAVTFWAGLVSFENMRLYVFLLICLVTVARAQSGRWDDRFGPCGVTLRDNVWNVLVRDGDKFYLGGSFGTTDLAIAQGRKVTGLPLVWDGKAFSVLGGGVGRIWFSDGSSGYNVSNTIVVGDSVIVVGYFDSVGGNLPAKNVAIWNKKITSWEALLPMPPVAQIMASTADKDDLFIAGYVYDSTLKYVSSIIRYNFKERKWYQLGLFTYGGTPARINAISLSEKNLFVGGKFVKHSGDNIRYSSAARWDRSTRKWHPLDTSTFDSDSVHWGAEVTSIQSGGGDIAYAVFNSANVRQWSGSQWHDMNKNVKKFEYPTKLVIDRGQLYLFVYKVHRQLQGDTIHTVATWNGSEWEHVFEELRYRSVDKVVHWDQLLGQLSMNEMFDGVMYNAGSFRRYNGKYVVPIDSGSCNGVDGSVESILAHNDTIYITGEFRFAGGVPAPGGAYWDGSGWNALGDIFDDNTTARGLGHLTFYQDKLYAAARSTLMYWAGDHWQGVGSGADSSELREIRDVAVYRDTLVLAGPLSGEKEPYRKLAKWDGLYWSIFDEDESFLGQDDHDDGLYTLAARGDDLYVGGSFVIYNGDTMNSIAHWDGTRWQPIITNDQRGVGSAPWGPQGSVNELAFWDSTLILRGSNFDSVVGARCRALAFVSETGITPLLRSGTKLSPDGPMIISGDEMYLADHSGYAANVTRVDRDGKVFSFGSAVDGIGTFGYGRINSMAVDGNGQLYVGGSFTAIGTKPQLNFSIWTESQVSVKKEHSDHAPLVTLSPNPCAASLFIHSEEQTLKRVRIFNAFGTTVAEFTMNGDTQFDVRNLPNAMYYMEVEAGSQKQIVKFIVSH